jgi:hypothetical protein
VVIVKGCRPITITPINLLVPQKFDWCPPWVDTVEKVRKPKSRETISRASITMSKNDSRQRRSLNHCFAPATIVPAEKTFSTVSVRLGHSSKYGIGPLHLRLCCKTPFEANREP